MSLISKIFSGHPGGLPASRHYQTETLQPETISIDSLKQLIPIRNLDEDELIAFASDNRSETFPCNSILFRSGEQDDSVLYLLEGSVLMKTDCGQTYHVDSGSAKARFPLSSGRQHSATARHCNPRRLVMTVLNS